MTKSAQMHSNGGWGAVCTKCGWHVTSPVGKSVLLLQCLAHNLNTGHNAHVC